jgi:hypothetical protein
MSAVALILTYILLSVAAIVLTKSFDPLKWGSGAAALAGGIGAWFWGRQGN